MSDTDSVKTDKGQPDLQQRYDKLAMEFAKARMQLNVLKKAYTAKTSKLDQRSVESLDRFENGKYDLVSTKSLDLQEDFNQTSQTNSKVNTSDELKSVDIKLFKQEINTLNHYICRVMESTKSNTLDYNLIMAEIEYCKGVQNSCSNSFCGTLNNELAALKYSVTACLYNILNSKLEARTKISVEDSRLIYPNHCCLDKDYESCENRSHKVYITLIFHFFSSFVVNIHNVLEYLLKEIYPDACVILQSSLKKLTYQMHNNSFVIEKLLIYCDDIKTIRFNPENIIMENIFLFVSKKYSDLVECLKYLTNLENNTVDCSSLRQNVVSFLTLKFPIEDLVASDKFQDTSNVYIKLNDVFDTIHILLRLINILEFEYFYKSSQVNMHWHMKNPLLHIENSKQAKEELKSSSNSQSSYEKIIHMFNEKLNQEMSRSLSLEQEKIHWENEHKLLSKKIEVITSDNNHSGTPELLVIENQMGKCESKLPLNEKEITREKELKRYFETKINNLIFTNKELSSQRNAYAMEINALKTQLDHSMSKHNKLELKLQETLEHIDDLKEEFLLTSTNYETQLRAMTEHLASLNETVVIERRHIDDLNSQLKIKGEKKKSSK